MSVLVGKRGTKKRWRGAQLTVIEVLVTLSRISGPTPYEDMTRAPHLLPRDVRKLPVFDNETLSANASIP